MPPMIGACSRERLSGERSTASPLQATKVDSEMQTVQWIEERIGEAPYARSGQEGQALILGRLHITASSSTGELASSSWPSAQLALAAASARVLSAPHAARRSS